LKTFSNYKKKNGKVVKKKGKNKDWQWKKKIKHRLKKNP
jgi:hypothetical protein